MSQKPFNQQFASEKLLQQAIAGLLTRVPDISDVQILQGAQELGKDIVFNIRGGFGESILCACVVKNTKITGDAGKAEGARTVYLQAQQAFDTPYVNGSGRDIYVERVYVVTPFDLPPATINSIRGKLNERSGQIVFIGGSTLFDLFKRHWPDYLADEAEVIEQHLKQILEGYENDNPLLGIALNYNLGNIKINSKKVYVPQLFFRKLGSYSLGTAVTKALPSDSELESPLTLFDINKIKFNLKRLEEALEFLSGWGFYNHQTNTIHSSITEFSSLLENLWRREVKRKHGELDRLDRAKVIPADPWSLSKLLRGLGSQIDASLTKLTNDLKELESYISSLHDEGIKSLSDNRFLYHSLLDHCAQVAPENLFTSKSSIRNSLPKNILDVWNGHLLIVGAPGYGKTSFCRWHALQDAERFNADKSDIIPVYVPLHRLAGVEIQSFEQAFLGTLGQSALLSQANVNRAVTTESKIRLYLDGLDEVPSAANRQQIVELAQKGIEGKAKYQIILTARDHIYAPYLNWLPRVSLGGFDEDDINALVDQWLGSTTEDRKDFYEQLRAIPALINLMHTPLLATLIILVFRQTGRLPENKTRLYEVFVELLSGGWDIAKRILRESKFGQRVKIIVLMPLASKLHEKRRREFGKDELRTAIRITLSDQILNEWDLMRDELVGDGLISRAGGTLQFSHLSFQEFLTAKDYIVDANRTRINRALEALLSGDDWWKEVVKFYIGLSGKPREISSWLLTNIQRSPYRNTATSQIKDLIKGVKESFPEFPIDELNY